MFEITGAKLVVDTSQLDAAIKKVDDLNKSVAKAEKDINKTKIMVEIMADRIEAVLNSDPDNPKSEEETKENLKKQKLH